MRAAAIFVLILVLLVTQSCIFFQGPLDAMPDVEFPSEKLNTELLLIAPDGWNDFRTTSRVDLDVKVISNNKIVFDPDCGIRTFLFDAGSWSELDNKITYMNTDDIVVLPGTDWLSGISCSSHPDLKNLEKTAQLRIFVFGHIYENDLKTNNVVGGYIDVLLKP